MRLEYFQMIDRFVAVDVGGRVARAICKVPLQSTVFEGHFPGYPLMPGVLLIECMAQTTGWLVSALTGFTGLPALAGVKEGKIRNAVFPGDELEFEGKVIHDGSGYASAKPKDGAKAPRFATRP
jgi:3-hydroxyacyl-[acyl-carrier-protein] dehydratase